MHIRSNNISQTHSMLVNRRANVVQGTLRINNWRQLLRSLRFHHTLTLDASVMVCPTCLDVDFEVDVAKGKPSNPLWLALSDLRKGSSLHCPFCDFFMRVMLYFAPKAPDGLMVYFLAVADYPTRIVFQPDDEPGVYHIAVQIYKTYSTQNKLMDSCPSY
jgi:hypothetical protein